MPLKRITFSGRLGVTESAEVWKTVARGLVCMVLDIVITLTISIVLFYMFAGYAVSPYERPIPCNDDSIKQPFKQNTVRMKHLLAVALGTPFFIICFVEALVYRNSEGPNKLANYFVTSTLLYLKYELTFALCVFLMEYLKCTVGRLRPHFLEACQPDWSRMDCTGRDSIPASETYCMNPDVHRVRTARTSFPSGHTAAAFHVLLFLGLYLTRMARITGIPSIYKTRNVLLVIFSIWTAFTAITRVTDYWHYPTDVLGVFSIPLLCCFEHALLLSHLGGIALALFCVLPTFGWQWRTYEDVYGPRQLERRRPHFE
ncbi:hypothetical protein Y032_0099g3169 [Ancylostoma ceylanicum]|uniref:Phosphatidic acid phosphatase type 2/haloperoxidase domain-containing protein n=1 Tax=Ancylostoma ceylanicum TaxID=53326 RepID=A0A016TIQ0_9BILA|nr:hypothetical protein Y032_0099g3169 [Ancylostoma ceylanicum]